MRTRLTFVGLVLVVALALPAAALADSPRAYHGTWDTAGWTFDPDTCPFPPEVPASGNWNVTIAPGQGMAVVHVTLFSMGIHVDSWGGRLFGDFWTVDAVTAGGFALHRDVPAAGNTAPARFTFVLDQGRLTFSIAPWVLLYPDGSPMFTCAAAVSSGPVR